MTRLFTGRGDDGTTGLYHGGRVRKDGPVPEAVGALDEAQAALGMARAETERGSELDRALLALQHDVYVVMAELSTASENHSKLIAGRSSVTRAMVAALEHRCDDLGGRVELSGDFVLSGQDRLSALLDVARTVVRRAERAAVPVAGDGSEVVPYLNRLSSLVWVLARWSEGEPVLAKDQTTLSDTDLPEEA